MARPRNPEARYSRVTFEDCEAETLRSCSIVIQTNFPIKTLETVNTENPSSLVTFLARIVKEWDGFGDLPCNEQGIKELDFLEIREMTREAMGHVTNPQMRNEVTLSGGSKATTK